MNHHAVSIAPHDTLQPDFHAASEMPMSALTLLWREVYANYPVALPFTEDELARFILMSGIDLTTSRIAYLNGQPIGLSLASRNEDQAWIGGFGVVMHQRFKGVGLTLLQNQIRLLEAMAVKQIRLEVLANNRARRLYKRAGFADRRQLCSFNSPAVGKGRDTLVQVAPEDLPALHRHMHVGASAATWQKSIDCVMRAVERDQLNIIGLADQAQITAYAVEQNRAGHTHLVDIAAESYNAAEHIIVALASCNNGRHISLGDEPATSHISKVLKRFGAAPRSMRMEMVYNSRQANRL